MPKVIIVNMPMMYHCVLHIQSMSLTSDASTPLMCCITMFAIKAFNFDCPYLMYIITNVIIMVTSAAVNRSLSARKLLRNDLNFEVSFVFLIHVLSCLQYSFCFGIELPNAIKFLEH